MSVGNHDNLIFHALYRDKILMGAIQVENLERLSKCLRKTHVMHGLVLSCN